MNRITNEEVCLVTRASTGLTVLTFQDWLQMVLAIMNNGAIGGGMCYGDEKHEAAIDAIEAQCKHVREKIRQEHEEDQP